MIPFIAPLLLKLSPVGAFLRRIPRPVWIAIAVAAILLLGTCAHQREVKKYGEERYAAGVKAANDAWNAKQIKANAKQTKRVAANKQQQTSASKDSSNDLTNDYAAIDARVERLRRESANWRDKGKSGNLSGTGAAASAAQCPAGQDGFPRSVVEPLLIEAARNQAQLNRILEWDTKQQKIADEFAAETAKVLESDR